MKFVEKFNMRVGTVEHGFKSTQFSVLINGINFVMKHKLQNVAGEVL